MEDVMFSRFLRKPFEQAMATGLISSNFNTLSGTWGALYETGELTYLNLVHLAGYDGTDPNDPTEFEMEGCRQVIRATEALRGFHSGCAKAKLRNFGMTLGIRDTYKIDALYNMTELDACHQGRFYDSIGIFPEFVVGYGILILPTTGRYFQMPYSALVPKSVSNLLVAGRITGGDKISHAARRNMMCCTVSDRGRAQRRQSWSSMAYLSRIRTATF